MTLDLVVKSGETSTPKGKEGLASIAASLLDEGTKSRTALQIAGELAEIGAVAGGRGRAGIDDGQPDHAQRDTWTGRSTCTPMSS